MKYPNCVFDLYGTLVDIHTDESSPLLWQKMALFYSAYGALYHPEELKEEYFKLVHQQEEEKKASGQLDWEGHPEIQLEKVFAALFEKKELEADQDMAIHMGHLFRVHSMEYIRLYEGVDELLRTLQEKGHKIYLLSNAQRVFTEVELRDLKLDTMFDGIWISSDYGCKKPDRKFYEIMLRESGIDPKQSIMVGNDGICDVEGAKAVGMSTLYIRSNISPQEPFPDADYILDHMDLKRVQAILTQA